MPTNMKDMMQFIQTIKQGGNPQQMVMNMLSNGANNNPVVSSLLNCVQNGDTKEIERIVRNVAKERGIDFDKEFNSFKQMFGL